VLQSGQPTLAGNSDAADFYLPLIVIFAGNALFFIFCQLKKDNSFIDAYWGISFVLPQLAIFIRRYADSSKPDPDARCILVLALVSIWAIRLCWHILKRHKDEDFRYK